jgi:hypothetical protein
MLDNTDLVRPFVPPTDDGDTFVYTELLDRTKKKGNNGVRIVKTFYHRSQADFDRHLPAMKSLCDSTKVRAYTRLAPRSFEKVAGEFLRLVTETYISKNFAGMKTLYARACGIVSPNEKIWMLDIDEPTSTTEALKNSLKTDGHLLAVIPSKKGEHFIIKAFDARNYTRRGGTLEGWEVWGAVSLHKDNGTNLYIPDDAA